MVKAGNKLELVDFYSASVELEDDGEIITRLDVWINPKDLRDLYTWDVNITGHAFHSRLGKSEDQSVIFGDWVFHRTLDMPEGIVVVMKDDGSVTSIKKVQ